MTAATVELLQTAPPDAFDAVSAADARRWCVELIRRSSRYGSALLDLTPTGAEADVAAGLALIALHRDPVRPPVPEPSEDADETPDDATATPDDASATPELDWRRAEFDALHAGETPRHPVFRALAETLPDAERLACVDALVSGRAAVPDADTVAPTWAALEERDRRRWGAAMRLVLDLAAPEVRLTDDVIGAAGAALAWTESCLHFGRIAFEQRRLPVPAEALSDKDPAHVLDRLRTAFEQRYAPDQTLLEESRVLLRELARRAWAMYDASHVLETSTPAAVRPMVWFALNTGGEVLHTIERWNFETAVHEPKLSRLAWWRLHRGARRAGRPSKGRS